MRAATCADYHPWARRRNTTFLRWTTIFFDGRCPSRCIAPLARRAAAERRTQVADVLDSRAAPRLGRAARGGARRLASRHVLSRRAALEAGVAASRSAGQRHRACPPPHRGRVRVRVAGVVLERDLVALRPVELRPARGEPDRLDLGAREVLTHGLHPGPPFPGADDAADLVQGPDLPLAAVPRQRVRLLLGADHRQHRPVRHPRLPDLRRQRRMAGLRRPRFQRGPGAAHGLAMGPHRGQVLGGVGGLPLAPLPVEALAQVVGHEHAQPAHAPLALHLVGERVHGLHQALDGHADAGVLAAPEVSHAAVLG